MRGARKRRKLRNEAETIKGEGEIKEKRRFVGEKGGERLRGCG